MRCHLCQGKAKNSKLRRCANFEQCRGAFCTVCLEKSFKSRFKRERLKKSGEKWVCFLCRGMCHCSVCQENRRKDLADIISFPGNSILKLVEPNMCLKSNGSAKQ
eukprot:TRINITY_DN10454_c0_g1_i1.p3 TRINITY_DN10454_c0_g1~~TRINITY_DN10454_c0_g1_i1.p3  ORF type:complete len:105 (+),score=18.19 TRINITY_DN10454_c0_g1_i1:526-840(+)